MGSGKEPPSSSRGFPLRVAAVDIGSNALRFAAAEFLDPSHRTRLDYRRVPVRLGHSAFLTGELTAENLAVAVDALTTFRGLIERVGARRIRVVATSAVRESRNGSDLVERVRREAGLGIEIIAGEEEARLVWLAVRDRFPLVGRWLLMDLGGGSLEISGVRQSDVEWSESHRVGTVRLLEALGGTDLATPDRLDDLIAEGTRSLRVPSLADQGLNGLIATGGNIEALARLARAPRNGDRVSHLPVAELKRLNRRLGELTYGQRVADLGLREDRADVIIPAGRVYERVAELAGAAEIIVPRVGVVDGVLLDLLGP